MFLPRSPHGAKKPQETSQRVRLPITDPLEGRTDRGPKAKAASRSWLWHRGLVSRHDELNETHRIAFYDTHPGPFPFFFLFAHFWSPLWGGGYEERDGSMDRPGGLARRRRLREASSFGCPPSRVLPRGSDKQHLATFFHGGLAVCVCAVYDSAHQRSATNLG